MKLPTTRSEPLPKRGGRAMRPVLGLLIAIIALSGGLALALWGAFGGGYENIDRLASVKCLGCLGLDPRVPGFSEFWTVYPEGHIKAGQEVPHPALVKDLLNTSGTKLLILFYWTQGCVPCAEQWEDMVEKDIASGTEENGKEGARFSNMKLLSVDAAEDMELYGTYRPKGTENGVPMTVFLFEKDNGIHWYSHYGKMEVDDVDGMINNILYHEISSAHT